MQAPRTGRRKIAMEDTHASAGPKRKQARTGDVADDPHDGARKTTLRWECPTCRARKVFRRRAIR
jgi:hypothetical protein